MANSTLQGYYICSPSGKFLGSVNSTNPDRIAQLMRNGLQRWEKLPKEQRKLPDPSLIKQSNRAETAEPKDGLILAVFVRDLPTNLDPTGKFSQRWNRDTAWFSKKEAQSIIPSDLGQGQSFAFPKKLVKRIAALHLLDTVNGQTEHFQRDEVASSTINAVVKKIQGDLVFLKLKGSTHVTSEKTGRGKTARGVTTNLLGNATYNRSTKKFTEFELVAVGRRWGHTRFNFRRDSGQNSNPIGFVMKLADKNEKPNPPAFIWAYKTRWVYENRK